MAFSKTLKKRLWGFLKENTQTERRERWKQELGQTRRWTAAEGNPCVRAQGYCWNVLWLTITSLLQLNTKQRAFIMHGDTLREKYTCVVRCRPCWTTPCSHKADKMTRSHVPRILIKVVLKVADHPRNKLVPVLYFTQNRAGGWSFKMSVKSSV